MGESHMGEKLLLGTMQCDAEAALIRRTAYTIEQISSPSSRLWPCKTTTILTASLQGLFLGLGPRRLTSQPQAPSQMARAEDAIRKFVTPMMAWEDRPGTFPPSASIGRIQFHNPQLLARLHACAGSFCPSPPRLRLILASHLASLIPSRDSQRQASKVYMSLFHYSMIL